MRNWGMIWGLSNVDSMTGDIICQVPFHLIVYLGIFFSLPRPGPKERWVDSVTHFHGNCLGGKGDISDVRSTVLTHLIKRLQGCFRDASQDVVKATMIGSFKLWPAKINRGTLYALISNLLFFDHL